jgi:tetratricopeptide (TPR) repeat protein
MGRVVGAEDRFEAFFQVLPSDSGLLKADLANVIGCLAFFSGNIGRALVWWETRLRIAEELGDYFQTARARSNIGLATSNLGGYAEAIKIIGSVLPAFRNPGYIKQLIGGLNNLATAHMAVGATSEAEKAINEAVELAIQEGEPAMIGLCFQTKGLFAHIERDFAREEEYLTRANDLYHQVHQKVRLVETHAAIAQARAAQEKLEAAQDSLRSALSFLPVYGSPKSVEECLSASFFLASRLEKLEVAIQLLGALDQLRHVSSSLVIPPLMAMEDGHRAALAESCGIKLFNANRTIGRK